MSANTVADIIPGGSPPSKRWRQACFVIWSGATFDVTTSVEEHYEPHKR